MILPDVNLLVYAYNADAIHHASARRWLEDLLSGSVQVAFTWPVLHGYIRLTTHPRIMLRPLAPHEALDHTREWLATPIATIVHPGRRHLEILTNLLTHIGAAGNMTTDAVLAALAIEYQAELHSNDADFSRFPGLRWVNPLAT